MSFRLRFAAALLILLIAPYSTADQPNSGFIEANISSDTVWDENAQYAGVVTVTSGHTLRIINSTIAVDFGATGGALTVIIEEGAALNVENSTLDGSTGGASISLFPGLVGRLTFDLGAAGQAGTLTIKAPPGENLTDLQASWVGADESENLSGESYAITIPSNLSDDTDLLIEHTNTSYGTVSRQIVSTNLQRGTSDTNTSADALRSGGHFTVPMPTVFSIIAIGDVSIENSSLVAMDLRIHGDTDISSTTLRASTPVHVYDQGSFTMTEGAITGCKEYSTSYAAEVVHHGSETTSNVSTDHASVTVDDLCKRSLRVLDTQVLSTGLPKTRVLLNGISPLEETYTLLANSEGTVSLDRGSGYRSIIEWIGPTGAHWQERATFNASWSNEWGTYSIEGDLGTNISQMIVIPVPEPKVTEITTSAVSANTNSPVAVTITVSNEGAAAGSFAIKCTVNGVDAQIDPRQPHITLQANESKDVAVTWRSPEEGNATLDCQIVEPSEGMPVGQSLTASRSSSAAVSFTLNQEALDDTNPTIIIIVLFIALIAVVIAGVLIRKGEPKVLIQQGSGTSSDEKKSDAPPLITVQTKSDDNKAASSIADSDSNDKEYEDEHKLYTPGGVEDLSD